jgi:hypothetical protein
MDLRQKAYSIPEIASLLHLSPPTIYWWLRTKAIACCQTGSGLLFMTEEQLKQFEVQKAEALRHRRRGRKPKAKTQAQAISQEGIA